MEINGHCLYKFPTVSPFLCIPALICHYTRTIMYGPNRRGQCGAKFTHPTLFGFGWFIIAPHWNVLTCCHDILLMMNGPYVNVQICFIL